MLPDLREVFTRLELVLRVSGKGQLAFNGEWWEAAKFHGYGATLLS
jgi:hypothetical protein